LLDADVSGAIQFDGFDETRRRTDPHGPDDPTLRQVRGDKNRAFLMD
jgi:hypothetical protein